MNNSKYVKLILNNVEGEDLTFYYGNYKKNS